MKKYAFLSLFTMLTAISCSENNTKEPVALTRAKGSEIKNDKPKCCASNIPSRFAVGPAMDE